MTKSNTGLRAIFIDFHINSVKVLFKDRRQGSAKIEPPVIKGHDWQFGVSITTTLVPHIPTDGELYTQTSGSNTSIVLMVMSERMPFGPDAKMGVPSLIGLKLLNLR